MPAAEPKVLIDTTICTGCGDCLAACPSDVFTLVHVVDRTVAEATYERDCCDCFLCELDCEPRCISVQFAPTSHGFRSVYAAADLHQATAGRRAPDEQTAAPDTQESP